MKKIITLFQRNYDTDRLVRDEIVPGAEWVIAGEGQATVKLDGTCCLLQDGKLYRRYELKRDKVAPAGFIVAQEPDSVTGDIPGWVPVVEGGPDKWHLQGYHNTVTYLGTPPDWTYELVGPHINANPEGFPHELLIAHGSHPVPLCPRTYDELKAYFQQTNIEGIVWWRDIHNLNCDKVKLKKKDFGLKR